MPKAKSNLDRVLDIFENVDIKEAQTLLELAARTVRNRQPKEAPGRATARRRTVKTVAAAIPTATA